MLTLAAARAANASTKLAFRPVALFVGGTSGIGKGTLEALARYTSSSPQSPGAHIIICGRNEASAQQIISTLPKHPNSKYEFLQCDASKLSNVVEACKTLKEERGVGKINYLFCSAGYLSLFDSYADNGEGLDRKMVLHCYSRFKFFTELLPLLQAAKGKGEEARVVSVLAAGQGGGIELDNLGVKRAYSSHKARNHNIAYTSLVMEELAKKYPSLSFTHIYPGYVDTPITNYSLLTKVIAPVFRYWAHPVEECAEYMLRVLWDPSMAKGAFHLDEHADGYPDAESRLHLGEPGQGMVYRHVMETIGADI